MTDNPNPSPVIYILSGGIGASGEQLVATVLAQFPDQRVRTVLVGNIRAEDQVSRALEQARAEGGLVVHTFVDAQMRAYISAEAVRLGVPAVDCMGPIIGWLSEALGRPPLQEPGRYRQLHQAYFHRVSAIEFTMAHDDGVNKEGWPQADAVLVGVSRSGKTPLSVYLAVLGWKVANIPLTPPIAPPLELFELDPKRVIGLVMDPQQLLVFRMMRQSRLGVGGTTAYTDLESIEDELRWARRVYRRGGFTLLNMTDKTIELAADEILKRLETGDRPDAPV